MIVLYSCSVDIHTLEFDEHQSSGMEKDEYGHEYDLYDGYDAAGYAEFGGDWNDCVYAESLVSAEDAKKLVYDKCMELRDKFNAAMDKTAQEMKK